jgi:REP element-mobilizing transposase RayT
MNDSVRNYGASDLWEITARCFQARALMTPHDPLVREVCGGVLAKAAEKFGVRIYAFAFLSNHFHLVIRARGVVVARFLQFLIGNLSRKLAPLCEEPWSGTFWQGRRSVIAILDDQALIDRVRYVLAHGVKEGLVARAEQWEGLHCAAQLVDGKPRTYLWFNWTRRWLEARKKSAKGLEENESTDGRGGQRYDRSWAEEVTLKLEPLPLWPDLSGRERRRMLQEFVDTAALVDAPKKPVGMERAKGRGIEIPQSPKRSKAPLCHTTEPELKKTFLEGRIGFIEAFAAAAKEWLRGCFDVAFPPGAFRPFVHNEVQIV